MADKRDVTDSVANTSCRKLLETAEHGLHTTSRLRSENIIVQKLQPTATLRMSTFQN